MRAVFAERFKSARLRKGYSLQELTEALDHLVSRQALHRYEKGEVVPDAEKINALSLALDVRPDYFFRTTQVVLGDIEFRKLSKMSQKEATSIREKTKEYLSRYLELEEIIGLSTVFENPLKGLSVISSYAQVNQAAERLRNYWNLGNGPLFNVVELLEDQHIKVIKLDVDDDFDGLQTMVNGNIPVIAYNAKKPVNPNVYGSPYCTN